MISGLLSKPNRIKAVFQRIDSGDEGADVAFNIATKALRTSEITWTDLLEAFFEKQNREEAAKPTERGGFSDIFASATGFKYTSAAAPTPKTPGRKQRRIIQGNEIPELISGKIIVCDRRAAKHGPMLVVNVEGKNGELYGPMAVFNKADINKIDSGLLMFSSGRVAHAMNPRHNPRLSQIFA